MIIKLEKTIKRYSGYHYGMKQSSALVQFSCPIGLKITPKAIEHILLKITGIHIDFSNISTPDQLLLKIVNSAAIIQSHHGLPVITESCIISYTQQEQRLNTQLLMGYLYLNIAIKTLDWVQKAVQHSITQSPSYKELEKYYIELKNEITPLKVNGVNHMRILNAAHRDDIPIQHISNNVFLIGQGHHARWLNSTLTDKTSLLSTQFAKYKNITSDLLAQTGLPVAKHSLVNSYQEALSFAQQNGFPVVLKPTNLEGGHGVYANIKTPEKLEQCYLLATRYQKQLMVETHQAGHDYRLTVLHGKLIKAIKRIPGGVIGNGKNNIIELIQDFNNQEDNKRRQRERGKPLLHLDNEANDLLTEQGLTPTHIPKTGQFITLRHRANISTGGQTQLVTNQVHPDNRHLAEIAAKTLYLDIAGIDLILPDISQSWLETGGIICEVNAQPQIGETGTPGLISQMLYQLMGGSGRISSVLVLGKPEKCHPFLDTIQQHSFNKTQGVVRIIGNQLKLDHKVITQAMPCHFQALTTAFRNRETQHLLSHLSYEELERHGLPSSRISLIIKQPIVDQDKGSTNWITRVKPHIDTLAFFAHDNEAHYLINSLEFKQCLLLSTTPDHPNLQRHLNQGGQAIWSDGEYLYHSYSFPYTKVEISNELKNRTTEYQLVSQIRIPKLPINHLDNTTND